MFKVKTLVIAFGALAVTYANSEDTKTERTLTMKAQEINNIRIEVTTPDVAKNGQLVEIKIKVINNSNQVLYFPRVNGVYEMGIKVVDSKNKPVEYTELGANLISIRPLRKAEGELFPGNSREYKIALSNYFKLNEGKYSLFVNFETWGLAPNREKFNLSVDKIPFVIN
jgi:hypothetical protein